MLRPTRLLLALALPGALLCPGLAAHAAQPDQKLVITDPSQAGPDFDLQGEYIGSSYVAGCGCMTIGLQVVALGDGEFVGVWYRGGLPGVGWDRCVKSEFRGQRQGSVAVLTSDRLSLTVDGVVVAVRDFAGHPQGQLQKTHRVSPTMGATPPANALILFDGRQPELLEGAKLTDDGLLMPGVTTTMPVKDFRLHLEFRTPFMPDSLGQKRGNSGVYIQRRYEVQILDSFGLEGEPNECGGLYKQQRPDVNMALPPLSWQTYDIYFTAARYSADGVKLANARITVYHNGAPIHCDREITSKTGNGRPEGPEPGPIHLQFHGDPVRYRNIWIVLPEAKVASCPPSPQPVVRRRVLRRPLLCRPLLRRRGWCR